MIDTSTFLWTMFIVGIFGLATLPSTSITGLMVMLKSASVGFFIFAGCLLCYLAYLLTPR